MPTRELSRRNFLRSAATGSVGAAIAATLQAQGFAASAPLSTGSAQRNGITVESIGAYSVERLNEILTLEWSFIDMEHRLLRLPRSKTGARTIHLNDAAIDVLRSIPRIDGNPYVICGTRTGQHLVNLQKPWRHIRHIAGLDDVRIHDLRHSFAAVAASSGLSLPMIGALLGHTQAQTTKRYAHLAENPLKAANENVGSLIGTLMGRQV